MNLCILSRAWFGVTLLIALLVSNVTHAGQITAADFTAAAVVENFEGIGNAPYFITPVVINGNVYEANGNLLDFSSKLGPEIGRSGVAIANRPSMSPGQNGFIDITLGNPALRAGMYVGSQSPWSLSVEFFAPNNLLIGTIGLNGIGKDSRFAGWQADVGTIARIRTNDIGNVEHGIIIDDLIWEVPEPRTTLGFAICAVSVIWTRRRLPGFCRRRRLFITRKHEHHDAESFSQFPTKTVFPPLHKWKTSTAAACAGISPTPPHI